MPEKKRNKLNPRITGQVNIKYLAKVSGLSTSTVSRALRKDPEASVKTINKVLKIAEKLNYYPDSIAKSLRSKKTYTIGVILNDINNPFYNEVLWAISESLNEKNYSTIVTYSNWDIKRERQNIMNLLSKKVDGIIISPVNEKEKNIDILRDNNIDTVFVDSYPDYKNLCYSGANHEQAAYIGTCELIRNNHREIILFNAMPDASFSKQFLKGYSNALNENKIKIDSNLIINLRNMHFDNGYNVFKEIIEKKDLKFSGIFAISDILAMSIYKAANELGISIPEDLSIVGYDNVEIVSSLNPPLTTVHQSRKDIGNNAVRILLHNINNKKDKINEKFITEPFLIKRKSVKLLK